MSETNPLLQVSKLHEGAFPFNLVENKHYLPGLKEAIKLAKKRLEEIKANPDPADFENTIQALETGADEVGLAESIFFNLLSAEADDEMHEIAKEFGPISADFSSDVLLDDVLFQRVSEVYEKRASLGLDVEKGRLLEETYTSFKRNGALLDNDKKEELRKIDQELSVLKPQFGENVLKATNSYKLVVEDETQLEGLPDTAKEAAAELAKEEGKEGSWIFTLHAPSFVPFLTYLADGNLRETLWKKYSSRAFRDEFDNQEITLKIAKLRHDRAELLGYKTHAHFVLEERMAETPDNVKAFNDRLKSVYKAAADKEMDELRDFRKELEGRDDLNSWDVAYFREKLKKKKFDYDAEMLRPYFKLEQVIDGLFEHARRLYDLTFEPLDKLPVYHKEVMVYEVKSSSSGEFAGLFYFDLFPREGKKGGAWMTTFRDQGLYRNEIVRPHVSMVCNFTKSTETKPSLLNFEEVRTIFHEFGHCLHALLSQCRYRSLSGPSVYWDFVELPSQIMENWVLEKESLDIFAKHYETGESIPDELAKKIKTSAAFFSGTFGVRQLSFGILDMAWHSQDPSTIKDVDEFESSATEDLRLLPKIEGSNFSCSFNHIFGGGYSAGYYSYKWAEVLDADAFELFLEKGLFNREVADSFRENILERGGTEHPKTLYLRFRGREPDPEALLRREGLLKPAHT